MTRTASGVIHVDSPSDGQFSSGAGAAPEMDYEIAVFQPGQANGVASLVLGCEADILAGIVRSLRGAKCALTHLVELYSYSFRGQHYNIGGCTANYSATPPPMKMDWRPNLADDVRLSCKSWPLMHA